jgi:hypothetical protein
MRHRSTRTSRHHLWRYFVLVYLLIAAVSPIHAQSAITVIEDKHEHTFQGPLTFRLTAQAEHKIDSVKLFYRVSGQTAAHKVDLDVDPGTRIEIMHTEDMGAEENYQPPMITLTYWWVIEDEAGNRLKTDPVSFVYTDTRFEWQSLENDQVRLYWHDQNAEFGQNYFDRAAQAASDLGTEFDVQSPNPVVIVIYNSHQEFMSVLQEASSEWTGAVSFGGSGCIATELGPESWMNKVIPHELTHASLDQIARPPFGEIPRWLNEGLAVRSEGGMSVEERAALDDAIKRNNLISLRVLNSPFSDQRDRAILSYAQSYSLVAFIIEEYGPDKLGELISTFVEGAHYDDAIKQVFGMDMDGLEDRWRAHLGAQPRAGTTRATPVPQTTPTISQTPEDTQPPGDAQTPILPIAATATAVAAMPRPTIPPVEQATPSPAPRSQSARCIPCLGAAPALAAVALLLFLQPRAAR